MIGDTFIAEDAQGYRHDCVVIWCGDRRHTLLAEWPSASSLHDVQRTGPAKGQKSRGFTIRATPSPRES